MPAELMFLLLLLQLCATTPFTHCKPLGPCYEECVGGQCDALPGMDPVPPGKAVVLLSSNRGLKFERAELVFQSTPPPPASHWQHIEINTSVTYQTVLGFGGAITDAMAVNMQAMGSDVQSAILDSYYGAAGSLYSIGRVPVGSCDFSTRFYSYCDEEGAGDLAAFNLTEEDTGPEGKIRWITEARQRMGGADLKLFASVWTAPSWLKEGYPDAAKPWVGGKLKADEKSRQTWALYLSKFLSAYKAKGVQFWGLTVENEPTVLPKLLAQHWESMFYTPEEQAEFLTNHLGPLMRKMHPSLKLMIHDDQKPWLVDNVKRMFNFSEETAQYVDGVAVHWYMTPGTGSGALAKVHDFCAIASDREIFILATEACNGFSAILSPPKAGTDLGNWGRGQAYAKDILDDLNAWAVGWTDWNLVLNMEGGPNHAGNLCDAPILVDTKNGSVWYKQPMYYFLAHFSRFIPRGSKRIACDSGGPEPMEATAFLTPQGRRVLVVLNRDYSGGREFSVHDPQRGYVSVTVPAASIITLGFD